MPALVEGAFVESSLHVTNIPEANSVRVDGLVILGVVLATTSTSFTGEDTANVAYTEA